MGQNEPNKKRPGHQSRSSSQKQDYRAAFRTRSPFVLIAAALICIAAATPEASKHDWLPTKQYSYTDVILAFTTVAYLIATICYVIISFRQWRVLRDTLRETQRSNNLSLRAWMEIERISLGPLTIPGNITVSGRMKNVGRLPAFNIQMVQRGAVRLPSDPPRGPEDFGSPQNLVPGSYPMCGGGESRAFDFPIIVSEANVEAIRGGSSIWLQIDLSYTDPIDTSGTTSNMMEYILGGQRFAFRRSSAK